MRKIHDSKLALLRRVPGLAGHSNKELAPYASLVDEVEVKPGQAFIQEGRPAREAFIVVEGEAEVTIDGHFIAHVTAGSFVGEMGILDRGPRTATVTATTSMRLLVADPARFSALVRDPAVAWNLSAQLSERLRTAETTEKEPTG